MAYVWQRWLAQELRAAGLEVVEVEGWRNRGRPASIGDFDPRNGFATHHTGSTSSPQRPLPTLRLLIEGRSDLPGPLCQVAVDYDGKVYVIAAGRANVNGRIGKRGVDGFPFGMDGNAIAMGNEVDTDGKQPLPEAQRRSIAVVNRVMLDHFRLPVARAVRHEDISGTGKWDIGQLTTHELRTDIAKYTPKPEEELDVAVSVKEVAAAVWAFKLRALRGPNKGKDIEARVMLQNNHARLIDLVETVNDLATLQAAAARGEKVDNARLAELDRKLGEIKKAIESEPTT